MSKKHTGTKEFLIGAMVGGIVGITAIALTRPGNKKGKHLIDSVSRASKALAAAGKENNLAEIIEWTAEGIELWKTLNKGRKGHA